MKYQEVMHKLKSMGTTQKVKVYKRHGSGDNLYGVSFANLRKLKKRIGDEIRSIFYASSKTKALEFFEQFKAKWGKELPSALKCLENSLEACLTYLQFPEEEWICLRTSNVIERVNKEFKRRTKPMEILAGERSCYTLLAFVCLKMEVKWRSRPIGKVPRNLPFFRKLAETNFTQNN